MTDTHDVLTVQEAADRLRVHPDTVRRLLSRGELLTVRVGRNIRILAAELDAYIRRGGDVPSVAAAASAQQIRALHAKANQLDRMHARDPGASKAAVMRAASTKFARQLESAGDLTAVEIDWILDTLALEIQRGA